MKQIDTDFILGSPFRTGVPIKLFYSKNLISSSIYCNDQSMYGKRIEPAGDYINVELSKPSTNIDSFEYGEISFKNPLFLEFKNTLETGWKKDLSVMFNNKVGKRLNEEIKKAGYDGVITIELYKGKYYFNESVNISSERKPTIKKETVRRKIRIK